MQGYRMGPNPGETNKVARRPWSMVIVWVLAASWVFLGASNLTLLSDRLNVMDASRLEVQRA